jgi:hypothetical protein
MVLDSTPEEDISCYLQLSTTAERCQDQSNLFRRGDHRKKEHKYKRTVLDLSPDEDVCLRRISFYDVERSISNNQAHGKLLTV